MTHSSDLSESPYRTRFRYGTAFGLRPRFFGVGLAVEVDAAVPFATRPAVAHAFSILLTSYTMAFFRFRVLLVSVIAVVNEVALLCQRQ